VEKKDKQDTRAFKGNSDHPPKRELSSSLLLVLMAVILREIELSGQSKV
jgi:hypothetical protein